MEAFLDRSDELSRLRRALDGHDNGLVCVYGRRRLGKSRLLHELLRHRAGVYYVGDDLDARVQRAALAREMDRVIPGCSEAAYPGWAELLGRFWRDAPDGAPLVLDEFPTLVHVSPELPSVIQKLLDRREGRHRVLLVSGSSQRMMMGLVLDGAAPLYGRARELLRLGPLPPRWLGRALHLRTAAEVVETWAQWGGVPRYWELAARYRNHREAVRELVLDPGGVLHDEPRRLLSDELESTTRAQSVLTLIGQGAHRVSEIARRLGQPATTLSRPLAQLVELGFVRREIPFGASERDSKRSLYRIDDPLLRFWFRFVEPNRSRLAARAFVAVERDIARDLPHHEASVWEDLVRAAIPRAPIARSHFGVASRWWGRDAAGEMRELDAVAVADDDPDHILVVEVKRVVDPAELPRLIHQLRQKVEGIRDLAARRITVGVAALRGLEGRHGARGVAVIRPEAVVRALG